MSQKLKPALSALTLASATSGRRLNFFSSHSMEVARGRLNIQ